VPVFNPNSVLYPQAPTLVALDDTFSVEVNASLDPTTFPAPGVLANDYSTQGQPLTAILSTDLPFGQGQLVFNSDGSFEYWPGMYGSPQELFVGTATFSYVVSDGENRSKAATVNIAVRQALHLSKEAEPMDGVRYDDTLTYTLTLSGAGQSATLWDPLPPNVSYVSDSLTDTLDTHAVYSPTARAIVWEGALPDDGSAGVIRFQAKTGAAGSGSGSLSLPIVNTAWLSDRASSLSSTVVVNGYRTYLPLTIRQ
jgi:uncharacterized repeat protein (TIGR01451 family)